MNKRMRFEEKYILEKAVYNLNEQIKPDEATLITLGGNESRIDGIVQIRGIDFVCEAKGNITNANANIVLRQLIEQKKRHNKPLLLVVKYIYPELMNEFSNQGINILDCAGNCFIRQDNLLLIVKGQKNVLTKEAAGRAFQETGIKLIFHFLIYPESVNLPYRTIQEKTNISLGAIKNVMEELTASHFILKTNQGRFLKNKKKLLERWVTAYNQTLKPKLLLEQMTFRNNEKRNKWLTMTLPEGMYWGGESGANLIDNYLYPGTFDIYSEVPARMLLPTGFVVPKEDSEIKIYQKFWLDKPKEGIVPPLLIYADLMGSGNSRCLEMAQKIYEHEFSDFE
ncbi:MAG: hypothetical protein LBR26_11520 [Prevotella sp.]|jgi:hypothetical protein|nr:hypothetical protein [Prevotella sp.]